MLQRICRWGLWISTILVLILAAVQGVSGNWTVFYLLWPGYNAGDIFLRVVVWLSIFHIKLGFAIGAVSIFLLIIIFAFLSKSNWWVRIFRVVGQGVTSSAAMGLVFLCTTASNRSSVGRWRTALLSALQAADLLTLFFMNKAPRWPWRHVGSQRTLISRESRPETGHQQRPGKGGMPKG